MFMTYEMPYEAPIATWDNVNRIININGKVIESTSYAISIDEDGRIFIVSQKRRKTKEEVNNSALSTDRRRDGEILIYRGKVEPEKADFLRLLVFDSSGKVIASADLTIYCDHIYIHGDRLFIIDSFKAMKIYEYKMSF